MKAVLAISSLLLVSSCATHLSDENLKIGAATRASFDMECPKDKIELIELSRSGGDKINSFGAKGCGKKAVYVRPYNNTNWVLNFGDKEEQSK